MNSNQSIVRFIQGNQGPSGWHGLAGEHGITAQLELGSADPQRFRIRTAETTLYTSNLHMFCDNISV
jgi:hypothetical protein